MRTEPTADHAFGPRAKLALDQFAFARGWFSIHDVVGLRKALRTRLRPATKPEAAVAKARQEADALIGLALNRPY